ncbi:MAG TPA: hypothetical protein VJ990_09180 [Clostridia bacterium]|nr:hypothetical protein [Clostridia bacterium]
MKDFIMSLEKDDDQKRKLDASCILMVKSFGDEKRMEKLEKDIATRHHPITGTNYWKY